MAAGPEVIAVPADRTRPLRQRVLRPMQAISELTYATDDHPRGRHFAIVEDGEVVGTASVAPDPHPTDPRPGDFRVRGMATDPAVRGRGYGAALLVACLAHARAQSAGRVWCNAREGAVSLYARAGLQVEGERFVIDPIGPHFLMAITF